MDGLGHISASGFRCFRTIENLTLGTLTVFFGLNGGGKTSFIRLFDFISALRSDSAADYIMTSGGAQGILHYGPEFTDRLVVSAGLTSGKLSYQVEMVPRRDGSLAVHSQRLETLGIAGYPDGPIEPKANSSQLLIRKELHWSPPIDKYISLLFDGHRAYDFGGAGFHSPMTRAANLHDNRFLREDGTNLAAFLYLLRQKHPDAYHEIVEIVRRASPIFSDFVLEPDSINPRYIKLRWKPMAANTQLDVSTTLSGSVLRLILVATLLLQPVEYRPAMIVLDESDTIVHPDIYPMLGDLIRRALTDTRIVLTTKSLDLISLLAPDDVVVADWHDGAIALSTVGYSDMPVWLQDHGLTR